MARNERKTEDLVRQHFKADATTDLEIEEQSSSDPTISKALKQASKHGKGAGRPEFLVWAEQTPGLVVVVECKADPKHHESRSRDQPKDFAVDGVLHYASALARNFDVIAVAASGQTQRDLRVSTFRHFKGQVSAEPLTDEHGAVDRLLPFAEYARLRRFDPEVRQRTLDELMAYSRELHNYMRDYAKVAEAEKPLLVSGALIALQDSMFAGSYDKASAGDLPEVVLQAMERVIKAADIPTDKRRVMIQPYQFIETHAVLNKAPAGEMKSPLQVILDRLDEHVRPFLADYHDIDVLGQFYGEFLRYSGGDSKGLGIVLTPKHIGELFARICNVKPTDTCLDICAGTGGFLIADMAEMDRKAGGDHDLRARIRSRGLIGIEQRPDMFSLAASNMMLRGDGKANLHQGSCFDPAITKSIADPDPDRHERPNVGHINPPYSQKGEGLDELSFTKHMMDCLTPGGIGTAIVPIGCAIQPSPSKEALLRDHTLLAVMSMPEELFYPVSAVTCIMVLKAHQPHADETAGTWFGYWKDDGHVKTKKNGRVDRGVLRGEEPAWPLIRDAWLEDYHNRREVPGRSVIRKVTADDEWCGEPYMETDFAAITIADFERVVANYATYTMARALARGSSDAWTWMGRFMERVLEGRAADGSQAESSARASAHLDITDWQPFRLDQIFEFTKGRRLTKQQQTAGDVPFVGSGRDNNGVTAHIGQDARHPAGAISVSYNGSVGEAFFQPEAFYASDDVNALVPRQPISAEAALFLCTLIRAERYRYSYGRKWTMALMKSSMIPLPVSDDGTPDFAAMETFIRRLRFADGIRSEPDDDTASD